MPLARFEDFLKRSMGLDVRSVGPAMLERVLQERLAGSASSDLDAYWDFLHSSDSEQQQLIEAMIVPETWFFRNREAFAAMTQLVRQQTSFNAARPLRILSLPCSSGEEPYSIAMALLDAQMPASHFHIDAVDINRQAVATARQAIYGKNSFRGDQLDFRERYFAPTDQTYALSDAVRQQVRFMHGNLFADDLLAAEPPYDILFCRNVLIYFDRATQQRAIALLLRRLTADGLLFVGPAETAMLRQHPMTPIGIPLSFAFRRHTAAVPMPIAAHRDSTPPASRPASLPLSRPRRPAPAAPAVVAAPRQDGDLDRARTLADQGRLDQAAQLCQQLIRQHGGSAAVYYLLGVIHDAADRKQDAAQCYRKVLYLEPAHVGALAQLAALLHAQGDVAGAELLQRRAERSSAQHQP
ncbi:CheR family methyltransferase [Paraherbaspirillum soli]|uniref:protein-glutamate O-methyltransferase n=1 Tax=Paraherbaspirillum soli TaxID=631222 RepID=A0ABW0M6V7_9BURK